MECGSLSNRTCICQNPLFTNAVAACALTKCSRGEVVGTSPCLPPYSHSHILRQTFYPDINQLFVSLCASVGGVDAILSEEDRLFATASLEIPAIPTYPLDVTGIDQASVILATATPAPNLGNPATGTDPGIFPPCVVCLMSTSMSILILQSLSLTCRKTASMRQINSRPDHRPQQPGTSLWRRLQTAKCYLQNRSMHQLWEAKYVIALPLDIIISIRMLITARSISIATARPTTLWSILQKQRLPRIFRLGGHRLGYAYRSSCCCGPKFLENRRLPWMRGEHELLVPPVPKSTPFKPSTRELM